MTGTSSRPEWAPEIEVEEALVRGLLRSQFPALAEAPVVPFAVGWDNVLWRVGEGIAFRFPRRAIAVPGVEREIAVLPAIAASLPLPIPVPLFVGRPGPAYPWPFFGSRLIPGVEPGEAQLDGRRAAVGESLGRFLRALHAPELAEMHGAGLPVDPMGRVDMANRVPRTRARLAALDEAGLWHAPAVVDSLFADALALPPADGRALVHGDLHVRHVLVDPATGAPTGVIDWGDVCIADPSVDLSLAWSLLDREGRAAFWAAYGPVSESQRIRARVLALFLNAALAQYAHDMGNAPLLAETLAGLDRTLADD